MMGWKEMAQRRLLDYETMKQAKVNLPVAIAQSELPKDADPDARLDMIAKKLFLKERLRQVKRWLDVTNKGLTVLTPEERLVVELMYILPKKGNIARLCDFLNCGQTTVYRRRDSALKKFTMALYGKGC